jgi:predicted transcriptional regulator
MKNGQTLVADDFVAALKGRLPSTPKEISEAIRLGEEDIKAGRGMPAEEVIAELERIRAKYVQKI